MRCGEALRRRDDRGADALAAQRGLEREALARAARPSPSSTRAAVAAHRLLRERGDLARRVRARARDRVVGDLA